MLDFTLNGFPPLILLKLIHSNLLLFSSSNPTTPELPFVAFSIATSTVSKIISIIEAHSSQQARVKYFDENPLDVKSTWANKKKAKNILGWVPTTDISDGLKDCVYWYEHNRHWAKNIELS